MFHEHCVCVFQKFCCLRNAKGIKCSFILLNENYIALNRFKNCICNILRTHFNFIFKSLFSHDFFIISIYNPTLNYFFLKLMPLNYSLYATDANWEFNKRDRQTLNSKDMKWITRTWKTKFFLLKLFFFRCDKNAAAAIKKHSEAVILLFFF